MGNRKLAAGVRSCMMYDRITYSDGCWELKGFYTESWSRGPSLSSFVVKLDLQYSGNVRYFRLSSISPFEASCKMRRLASWGECLMVKGVDLRLRHCVKAWLLCLAMQFPLNSHWCRRWAPVPSGNWYEQYLRISCFLGVFDAELKTGVAMCQSNYNIRS